MRVIRRHYKLVLLTESVFYLISQLCVWFASLTHLSLYSTNNFGAKLILFETPTTHLFSKLAMNPGAIDGRGQVPFN